MILAIVLSMQLMLPGNDTFIVSSVIDISRMIGLPRLKILDSYMFKTVQVNEFERVNVFSTKTRIEFFKSYMKFNFISHGKGSGDA
jgi:hypothetical protein